MPPPLDIGVAIGSLFVTNRQIHNFEIQLRCAQDKIEVSKWIKIAEVMSIRGDEFVVPATQNLGATKSVLYGLAEQPGKSQSEKFIEKLKQANIAWGLLVKEGGGHGGWNDENIYEKYFADWFDKYL